MDLQLQKQLIDELASYAKEMERNYENVVATFDSNDEAHEISVQIKNGLYLMGETRFIENPEVTSQQYLDYISKIQKTMNGHYDNLKSLHGDYRVVKDNAVPDFVSIAKNVISNTKPKMFFKVKVSDTRIDVDNDGSIQSFPNNINSSAKVLDLANSTPKEGVGYKLSHHGREVLKTQNKGHFMKRLASFFEH